ncbi:MAG: hypothetical protein LBS33_03630 [Streptococcaceae bacterium]|jgi:hypothetical protein|nr:hypothetical protein [Streptococcaceae bacterium]
MVKISKLKIKTKVLVIVGVLALALTGMGGKMYIEKKHQELLKQEQETIQMETKLAKTLKNKIAGLEVIEFNSKYPEANGYNKMIGWEFTLNITTK